MKTRSSLKPVPATAESTESDQDQEMQESIQVADDSMFTLVKEKRKLLMPEKEIAALMYAFGDSPEQESVHLMDELLQDYLIELVSNVDRICKKPKTVHFLQALSNNPKQHYRAKELLALDKELKSARSVFDIQEMAKTQFQ
jgi:transcription initiation factor TFIID subunit 13